MRVLVLNVSYQDHPQTLAIADGFEALGARVELPGERDWRLLMRDFDLVYFRLDLKDCPRDAERHLREARKLSDPLPAIIAARDKRIGQSLLDQAGLLTPTWIALRPQVDLELSLGFTPWVIKPIRGAEGKGIILTGDKEEALSHQLAVGPCIAQRYLPAAKSYRILASPTRALAIYERRGPEGRLVQSVSSGADRVDVDDGDLRESLTEIGIAACAAAGGHVLGVDVLEDSNGRLWPLEVNVNPGFDPDRGLGKEIAAESLHLSGLGPRAR